MTNDFSGTVNLMFRTIAVRLLKLLGLGATLYRASLLFGQTTPSSKPGVSNPTASAYQPHLAFDVVSIRESSGGNMSYIENLPHNSLYLSEKVPALGLVLGAYDVKLVQQLENLPGWAMDTRYTITAKSDTTTDETLAKLNDADARAEKHHMLQLLLAERFHLQIHSETRTSTTYELIARLQAVKLMTPVQGDISKTISTCNNHNSPKGIEVDAKGCPFSILLSTLQQYLGTNVIDHTGMSGMYAYHLMWMPSQVKTQNDLDRYPNIKDAFREQLGLELKQTKGPVTYWVVDHIERPTPN